MTKEFDVAIIGAGPAGSVTAMCLARWGRRVALVESGRPDRERYGETLPPEINPVLERLGLPEFFHAQKPLESPGIVSSWGGTVTETDFTRNAYGCGWHIDRNRFDAGLRDEAVKAGAQLGSFPARFTVNARGRLSGVEWETEDRLLAIVLRIRDVARGWKDRRTFIETAPAGWWYSTLLPDGTGLAMLFTGAEVYREFGVSISDELQFAPLTRACLESGQVGEPKIVYVPSGRAKKIAGEDWLCVGDSASAYDPLSGQGISKALRHAVIAAEAIDAKLNGDAQPLEAYAAKVNREFDEYSRQRREFYASERRWPEQPFWRARYSLSATILMA
jgi:flavin-dependent dehydrogenase